MKSLVLGNQHRKNPSRPPRGGRGLKFLLAAHTAAHPKSPPSRGAWIEMPRGQRRADYGFLSPPSRGAWIEMRGGVNPTAPASGRPPRGGRGLKYASKISIPEPGGRPPRGGRGLKSRGGTSALKNSSRRPPRGGRGLKSDDCRVCGRYTVSPPSRGAWIEMSQFTKVFLPFAVAPLAGGVD